MTAEIVLPIAKDDGLTHINTQKKAKTELGRVLALSHETGESIYHPILGPFRSVENMWLYLNTGGSHDKLRSIETHLARSYARLLPKYSCNRFWELTLDLTLVKLETNSYFEQLVVHNQLPYDHYWLNSDDRVPIRPSHSKSYIDCLTKVESILRTGQEHDFVRFSDMEYKLLP